MNTLQTITQHAFKLPSMAAENEEHIGWEMRKHELAHGHRRAHPATPPPRKIALPDLQQSAQNAVLDLLANPPAGTPSRRFIISALKGVAGSTCVTNACRNLCSHGLIRKADTSMKNLNVYEITPKGRTERNKR